ncbi:unnamed protein product [Mytilus coruscus]|uniref:Uncharacterized protein n=1 Tax=Mytilus coruscus TaxID=42192 RepID=A0A6J8CN43_MYTCO|nr:unnamed protein product [Mytilus coruscus]
MIEINKRQKDMKRPGECGLFEVTDEIYKDSDETNLIKDKNETEQKEEEASKSGESNSCEEAEYWLEDPQRRGTEKRGQKLRLQKIMENRNTNKGSPNHVIRINIKLKKKMNTKTKFQVKQSSEIKALVLANEKQKNDQNKGEFWTRYGKQKDSGSNSESPKDKDNVDSPELGDTDSSNRSSKNKTASSRSSDSKASDVNEVQKFESFEKREKPVLHF